MTTELQPETVAGQRCRLTPAEIAAEKEYWMLTLTRFVGRESEL